MYIKNFKSQGMDYTVLIWEKQYGHEFHFVDCYGKIEAFARVDFEKSNNHFRVYDLTPRLFVKCEDEHGIPQYGEAIPLKDLKRFIRQYEKRTSPHEVTLKFTEGGWYDSDGSNPYPYTLAVLGSSIIEEGSMKPIRNPKLKYEYLTSDN